MKRHWNISIWAGFLLAIVSSLSYFMFFSQFPVTRDFPWANLVLLVLATYLLVVGLRRVSPPGGAIRRFD